MTVLILTDTLETGGSAHYTGPLRGLPGTGRREKGRRENGQESVGGFPEKNQVRQDEQVQDWPVGIISVCSGVEGGCP